MPAVFRRWLTAAALIMSALMLVWQGDVVRKYQDASPRLEMLPCEGGAGGRQALSQFPPPLPPTTAALTRQPPAPAPALSPVPTIKGSVEAVLPSAANGLGVVVVGDGVAPLAVGAGPSGARQPGALAVTGGSPPPATCKPFVVDGGEHLPPMADFPALVEGLARATDGRGAGTGMHTRGHACTVTVTFGTADFVPQLRNFLFSVATVGLTLGTLVVGLSSGVCQGLAAEMAAGVVCVEHPSSVAAGDFGSPQFTRLTHVKTEVALAVVHMGYSVLLVDSDTVFVRNPFPYLQSDDGLDLVIQVGWRCGVCVCVVEGHSAVVLAATHTHPHSHRRVPPPLAPLYMRPGR
jgi:hypothetical protein